MPVEEEISNHSGNQAGSNSQQMNSSIPGGMSQGQEEVESQKEVFSDISSDDLSEESEELLNIEREVRNTNFSAMLERMINPVDNVSLEIKPHGLFNPPQKLYDMEKEMSGLFDYRIKLFGQTIKYGLPNERQLTEEEIEALKSKKKKVDKNQTGETEKSVEPEIVDDGLTDQQREWKAFEDPFKHGSLRWDLEHQEGKMMEKAEAARNVKIEEHKEYLKAQKKAGMIVPQEEADREFELTVEPCFQYDLRGEDLKDFEEAMNTGKLVFYMERYIDQEKVEYGKTLKKAKNALLPEYAVLRCKVEVNLGEAQVPGTKNFVGRGKVVQVDNLDYQFPLDEEELEQDPLPEISQSSEYDFEGCYFKIEMKSDSVLTPEIGALMPSVEQAQPTIKGVQVKISDKKSSISAFKTKLKYSMYAIANDYSQIISSNHENKKEEEKKYRVYNKQAEIEAINSKKESYLNKFVVSEKYQALRKSLRKSILQLVHDKMEKNMGPDPQDEGSKPGRLVSEIHIFLKKELKVFLDDMMQSTDHKTSSDQEDSFSEEGCPPLHEFQICRDLLESYKYSKEKDENFQQQFIGNKSMPAVDRYLKLCSEYESLNMRCMAQRRYKDILMLEENNHKVWYEYCKFKLRELNFVDAEEALWQAIKLNPTEKLYQVLSCCFYVRRDRIKEAQKILEALLQEDRLNTLYNCFMALIYQYYLDNPKLCRKYFNVAQRVTLRRRGMLPPKKDKPDYGKANDNIELPPDKKDQVWMELIVLLANHSFIDLAVQGIDRLENNDTRKVHRIFASIEFLKNNYEECDKYLDSILEKSPEDSEILIQKALNSYMCERFYEAEEYIFRALRSETAETNFATLLRLGYMYLKRESTEDAKIILMKACSANQYSTLAWLGLGIACIKLDNLIEAEQALRMANILDPINADVWGYSVLLALKSDRIEEALSILERYYKLQIEDLVILNEIGNQLVELHKNDEALKCYEMIDTNFEKFGGMIINSSLEMGQIYWMIGELRHDFKDYGKAVQYYEKALGAIEGQINRKRIQGMMDQAVKLQIAQKERGDGDDQYYEISGKTEGGEEYEDQDYKQVAPPQVIYMDNADLIA